MQEEIWKDIVGYEGLYQVSNFGRIKSFHKNKEYIKALTLNDHGYSIVNLNKNKKQKTFKVHRLVSKAFIPNPNNYLIINHIDGNKINNNVDNLEWCTQSYNASHGWKNHLNKGSSKKVLQYDLQGNLVGEFISSSDASRVLHINGGDIRSCCLSLYNHKTAGGYIWKYAD